MNLKITALISMNANLIKIDAMDRFVQTLKDVLNVVTVKLDTNLKMEFVSIMTSV